jgi:hypothetical protein
VYCIPQLRWLTSFEEEEEEEEEEVEEDFFTDELFTSTCGVNARSAV